MNGVKSEAGERILVAHNVDAHRLELEGHDLLLFILNVADGLAGRVGVILGLLAVQPFLSIKFFSRDVVEHVVDLVELEHLEPGDVQEANLVVLDGWVDDEAEVRVAFSYEAVDFEDLFDDGEVFEEGGAEGVAGEHVVRELGEEGEQVGAFMQVAEVLQEVHSVDQCSLVHFN